MTRKIDTEDHVKALVKEWFDESCAWHYAPIQNGMGVHGIPDRIGCVPIVVTQEMVGKTVGVFVAVEAKKPGRRSEPDRGLTKHQNTNINDICDAGGFSIVCDGVDDLQRLSNWIEDTQENG